MTTLAGFKLTTATLSKHTGIQYCENSHTDKVEMASENDERTNDGHDCWSECADDAFHYTYFHTESCNGLMHSIICCKPEHHDQMTTLEACTENCEVYRRDNTGTSDASEESNTTKSLQECDTESCNGYMHTVLCTDPARHDRMASFFFCNARCEIYQNRRRKLEKRTEDLRKKNRTINTRLLHPTFTRPGPYHPSTTLISAPFRALPKGEHTANELQSGEESGNLPLDLTVRKFGGGVQSALAKATHATPAEEETVTQDPAPVCDVQSTEDPRPSTSRKTSQEASCSFKRSATDHPPASLPKRVSTDSHYGLKCRVMESAFNGRVFNSCIENTRQGNRFLVKWYGFPVSQWINKEDLV